MAIDLLRDVSPLIIISLSGFTLYGLHEIYKMSPRWELTALKSIPFVFIILYSYILFFHPDMELARNLLRLTLSFSFAISSICTYFYNKSSQKGNHKRYG